ncbi:MAG: hypothetical protein P8185_06855 [Deltaproteobacteria bacterium]|jgi:hypothetical protein
MAVSEDTQHGPAAFDSGPLDGLTIQDALIISAVFAIEADTEKCKHIKKLAEKHPLFAEKPEDTSTRVNKFVNLMQADQPLKAVEAAVSNLRPEHRIQAFEFAIESVLAVGGQTGKKQKILKTLAAKLALENDVVDRKLRRFHKSWKPENKGA